MVLWDLESQPARLCDRPGTQQARPAVRYSKFKMSEARPPPLLGQHTTHILKEVLRYDDEAIGELLSAAVVTQHKAE
ncbi:hypothetical protein CB1_000803014 [Camelus ferus]|nr:hypothetical protein CB1_000803014 [Camelus ferus]